MRLRWAVGAVLLLLLVPLAVDNSYVRHLFILAFIYAVLASNWDFSQGYGGIFNFGHLSFFGLGAYSSGILIKQLEWNPWLALLVSGAVPVLAALLVGLPVVRLKGIYVVLVTFAFGQLCLQLILSQAGLTGGSQGLVSIEGLWLGDYALSADGKLGYYYVGLGLLALSTLYLRWLVRSDFGLSVQALRDQEEYAAARGISLPHTRLLTLMASSLFTGIAGGFYAIYLGVVSPDVFSFAITSTVLGMLLLGGLATIYGPILAAFIITFGSEVLVSLGPVRFLIIAGLTILVLRLLPGGLYSVLELFQSRPGRSVPTRQGRPE
ncbi:MAG: branched-chain amino acid ABC transporter permease [Meiothermus sp.]|nr:branched-chain amino acid ABC transporter permease [Meiothermus sp.]